VTGDPWRPADESGAAPAPQGSYGDGPGWDAAQQAYPQQAYEQQEAYSQQAYQPQEAYPQQPYQQSAGWSVASEPTDWNASGYPADPQPTQIVGGYGQPAWPAAGYGAEQQPTQIGSSWPGAGYDQQPTQLAYQAPQTPLPPQAEAPQPTQVMYQAPQPQPQPQQPPQSAQPSSRIAQNWGAPASSAFAQGAAPGQPAPGYQPTSVLPPLPGRAAAAGEYEVEDRRRPPAGSDKLPRFVREHPTEVGLGAAVVVASLVIVGVLSLGGGDGGAAAAQAASTLAATRSAGPSATPSGQAVVVPEDTAASPSPSASPSASAATVLAPGATGALVNAASGLCLTTSDPNFGQGSPIVLAACAQAGTQAWTDTAANQLTQNNNAGCLDDYGQGTTAGTEVDLWPCNGGGNQQWTLLPDGTIVGKSSNLCVSPVGDATAAGTQVVLEACDGSAAQRWS